MWILQRNPGPPCDPKRPLVVLTAANASSSKKTSQYQYTQTPKCSTVASCAKRTQAPTDTIGHAPAGSR